MGEKPNNRRAFEQVTRRIMLHEQMRGREPNERAARAQAADVARVRDQQREDGSARNRAARQAESVPHERASGRILIDMGRGKR